MKMLKNKFILSITICLAILLGTFVGLVPTKSVSADTLAYECKVEKVRWAVTQNGDTYERQFPVNVEGDFYVESDIDVPVMTVTDNDNVLMLHNSDMTYADIDGTEYFVREYFKVSFLPSNNEYTSLQYLVVNASLDGMSIDTKEVTSTGSIEKKYEQYFDLTDIKELQSQNAISIEDAQGYYTFTFEFMSKINGITNPPETVTKSFYALNENSYVNVDANSMVEPKIANTEKIDRTYYTTDYANEVDYFNFNNQRTKDYFGVANLTDTIYFPTITYDATKYYFTYSKLIYGVETIVTSNYADGIVTLTYASNGKTTTEQISTTNGIANIVLRDIGAYNISFDYVVKQYNTENYVQLHTKNYSNQAFDKTNMFTVENENWNIVGDVDLYIYGYQLNYSIYKNTTGVSDAVFANYQNNLYADVTNANIDGETIAGINTLATESSFDGNQLSTFANVVSTNQAPLFFDYNASLIQDGITSKSYYTLNGGNPVYIESSTRFTEPGEYQIYLVYNYARYEYLGLEDDGTTLAVKAGNNIAKVQTFAFKIENIDPELELLTKNTDGSTSQFVANGFTNNNVLMNWDISNEFNVLPEIIIASQSFGSDTATVITNNFADGILNGQVELSDSALYIITINYGPCVYNTVTQKFDYSASVTYNFTIDKQTIDSISIFAMQGSTIQENDTTSNIAIVGNEIQENLTASNFAVTYGNLQDGSQILKNGLKPSGAKITASYTFIPFTSNNTYGIVNESYILNGYSNNGRIDSELNYSQIANIATYENGAQYIESDDLNAVLSDNGIYIFTFTDSAGNTTTKTIVLDTTKTIVMQKQQGETEFSSISGVNNIVSIDVDLIWGSHKAIKLENVDSVIDILASQLSENIYTQNNISYYVLKIKSSQISSNNNLLFSSTSDNGTTLFADVVENNPLSGENVYDIQVVDELSNKNNQTYVEMNFDKSLLMAHFEGDAVSNVQTISTGETTSKQKDNDQSRLFINSATNKQRIYVSWLANIDTQYQIASVVCKFYPLTFDQASTNYPYSATATQTINLSKNTTAGDINGESRTISSYINLVQDERYGTTASMAGMYEVVRTYQNQIPEDSRDVQERTYKFYVDRQNIISYFNNEYVIGKNIEINMQHGNKTFSGAQFLQEFTNSYVLSTNKLPVKVNVPTLKYDDVSNNVLRLSYFIKNDLGQIVYDSTNATSALSLTQNDTYTVTIYDNTDGTGTTEYRSGVNEITLSFKIDNSAPKIIVVNQNNVKVNDDSFNTNKIKAVWTEDSEGYKANIDQNNMTIRKLFENGSSQVVYEIKNGVISANSLIQDTNIIKSNTNASLSWTYEIDLSQIAVLNENCKYEIIVQYKGNEADYGNNFRTTKTIYFDYTAPEYNYNNLLASDKFLTESEKTDFNNLDSKINFENYAFVVDETYQFAYAPASSFWSNDVNGNKNDSISIWFRKYTKYSSEIDGESMQSIVPSDERYSTPSLAPQRLRFNENLKDANGNLYYTEVSNRNQPFYDIVHGEEGYYEIIEKDCAGNYRVYTIALYQSSSLTNLSVDYSITVDIGLESDSQETQVPQSAVWTQIASNQYQLNVNNKQMQISAIDQYLNAGSGNNWFDVVLTSIKNEEIEHKAFRTAPIQVENYISIEDLIDQINLFVQHDASQNLGYTYSISIKNAYGLEFIIDYRTPGQTIELDFVEASQSLNVSFEQDPTSSTYITEFYVYEAKDGKVEYTSEYLLERDSLNREIILNPSAPSTAIEAMSYSYTFRNSIGQGRNLTFVYVDNFGVMNKVNKIIGLTDISYENMISFDGEFDKTEVIDTESNLFADKYYEYYTNSIAKLNYQPKIYSLEEITLVSEDGTETTLELELLTTIDLSNGTRLVYIYSDRKINTHDKYIVKLSDTTGNSYKFVVHYYSKLADLTFKDSSNYVYDLETINAVSRTIYLDFDKNQYSPYETFVSVNKTYIDLYGNQYEENYTIESVEDCVFSDHAKYVITASNRFGDSKQYSFTIRQSTATYFSVLVKPDGVTPQAIEASDIKYSYMDTQIDQYFTIYDNVEIDVNSSRDLVIEDEDIFEIDQNTTVYRIHSTENALIPYEKYIAITIIDSSTDFVSGSFAINEQIVTGKTAKLKTKTVSITLPAYYQASGNKVQVELYFNSQYIGNVKNYILSDDGSLMTFELNDCGVYQIYVSDYAGNKQLFGDSKYFTLYVLNNVIYKLNGQYGIYNSIFNNDVILTLEQTSQFDRQTINGRTQFISVNATLNGKDYTPSQSSGSYIFRSYGTYVVTLTGIVNGDTENPVVTTAKFSIINKNEAKVAHEYIGLNGYEVISIVKDDADITDNIRESLDMLTLNSFAVSGGLNAVGGNGKYKITVKVTHNEIIPSQTFSYEVWVNNDTDALILCSLKEGESTIDKIKLQLNLYQIYSKVGECYVRINGNNYITINANTASENKISVYELTTNQRYNVTLETNSGNTLLSFVVTKVEPLNTVAIIVIVVVSIVVIGLTVTFILLRKKMKVR